MSDAERWQRLDTLFAGALRHPADRWGAYLDEACGTDTVLRAELESLLRAHADAGGFLEGGPIGGRESGTAGDDVTFRRLTPGTTIGAFEIVAALGVGGMGAVYRARDSRLGRSVAIKILTRPDLGNRNLQRFEREARAISMLTHPHICTLYDICRAPTPDGDGDIEFLVMELVHGETLAAHLSRGPLPLDRAVQYAIEIADALTCAHRAGIVHRDLKPQNIMVTGSGTKLLDFGLATFTAGSIESASGAPSTLTVPGVLIGTVQYMAPEQIQGRESDARADLFSFGLVLHEMLAGRRAFDRPTTIETLNAILKDDPAPLPNAVPEGLRTIVRQCLEKARERRFQSAQDLGFALRSVATLTGTRVDPASRRRHLRVLWMVPAAALLVAVGALVASLASVPAGSPAPMQVFPLTTLDGYEATPTISPDGSQVAFAWNGDKQTGNFDIYVQIVGSPTVRRVTTDPATDLFPNWSPDGRQIAFVRGVTDLAGRVYVTSPVGGEERKLSDLEVNFDRSIGSGQLSWSPDGRYVAAGRSSSQRPAGEKTGIYVIATDTGQPRLVTDGTSPGRDSDPAFSPDGRRLAYFSCNHRGWGFCDVAIVDLRSDVVPAGPPRKLTSIGVPMYGLAWAPDGRSVVFGVQGRVGFLYLWRADVDGGRPPERLDVAGLGARHPAIAASRNRLVFAAARTDSDVYRTDGLSPPRPVAVSSFGDSQPTFSPDGQQIAFVSSRSGEAVEIWVAAADGSNPHRLTHGLAGWQSTPSWAPDGRSIAFDSGRSIWTIDVDGANLRRMSGTGNYRNPTWSTDGRSLYVGKDDANGWEMRHIRVDNGREEHITSEPGDSGLGTRAFETADGKSLVYAQAQNRHGAPVMILSLTNRTTRQLVPCAYSCSVGAAGVYYYPCRSGGIPLPWSRDRSIDIRLVDPGTGVDRQIATLTDVGYADLFWGPVISPDANVILYAKDMTRGHDLMLIENFR